MDTNRLDVHPIVLLGNGNVLDMMGCWGFIVIIVFRHFRDCEMRVWKMSLEEAPVFSSALVITVIPRRVSDRDLVLNGLICTVVSPDPPLYSAF